MKFVVRWQIAGHVREGIENFYAVQELSFTTRSVADQHAQALVVAAQRLDVSFELVPSVRQEPDGSDIPAYGRL